MAEVAVERRSYFNGWHLVSSPTNAGKPRVRVGYVVGKGLCRLSEEVLLMYIERGVERHIELRPRLVGLIRLGQK